MRCQFLMDCPVEPDDDTHKEETPTMTDAYIYDALRTPRGKGKKSGSLHEITALQLATQALEAVRDRNDLDTRLVDDVVLGCVSPVGEQGADIARAAVLNANYAEETAGVQINRFCASALEATNMAAAKVMSGEADFAIGGGVEAMSRVPMGSDGGAMVADPELAFDHYFVPQGVSADLIATKYGYSRDDVDAYAVESQKRAKAAAPASVRKTSRARPSPSRAARPPPATARRAPPGAPPSTVRRASRAPSPTRAPAAAPSAAVTAGAATSR